MKNYKKNIITLSFAFLTYHFGFSADSQITFEGETASIRAENGFEYLGGWVLFSNGEVGEYIDILNEGEFEVHIRVAGTFLDGKGPDIALDIDGFPVEMGTITATGLQYQNLVYRVKLSPFTHRITASFVNDEINDIEDRNVLVDSITIKSTDYTSSLTLSTESSWISETSQRNTYEEQTTLALTNSEIEKHRKNSAFVIARNTKNIPYKNAKVSIKQIEHDFLFGANIMGFNAYTPPENSTYLQKFSDIFNYATAGIYWKFFEPTPGNPNYNYLDSILSWADSKGIQLKAHSLLWAEDAGIPTWWQGLPTPQMQNNRIYELMTRYKDRIQYWDVVNEPSHFPELPIHSPYAWARSSNPQTKLIINEYDEYTNKENHFFRFLRDRISENVPFDIIGLQSHNSPTELFPLLQVKNALSQYQTLGKEIHITEFSPPSNSSSGGPWDEDEQADYVEKFYRVAFANPNVKAISWWDFTDKYAWKPGGGLLRNDMSSKPAYEALKQLITSEWKTNINGATNSKGRYNFSGFHGRYEITVTVGTKSKKVIVDLKKDSPNKYIIKL